MHVSQQNKYLETRIQTASSEQLLLMLCDAAIKHCKLGVEAIHTKQIEQANHHLGRVQDIISEWRITLDHNAEIAADLLRLYEYFSHRLIEANVQKKAEPAEEVLGYLQELKETWLQAAQQVRQQASGKGTIGNVQYG